MALRFDYLARETGQNLRRNWLLSSANVLIVTVSLTMFGITSLLGDALGNAFIRWNNDVSFIVYMDPGAPTEQIDSIDRDLAKSKQVDEVEYFDMDKSYELAKKLFRTENPELLNNLKKEDLPTSFRVKPTNPDAAVVKEMAATYVSKPGVYKVDFPDEQVRQVQRAGEKIGQWLLVGVIALLVASIVLIFIAIQTAVFSRRREIEVMRLVGATNWFIRIPFIVEGVIQGLVGAMVSIGLTYLIGSAWKSAGKSFSDSLLGKLVWTASQANSTYILILVIGAAVGAVGSFVSTLWYLRD